MQRDGAPPLVRPIRSYMKGMKPVLILTLAAMLATPVPAQEAEEDGLSLIERGARMMLEGLADEMAPAMQDLRGMAETMGPKMRDFVTAMGPALADILSRVDDITLYHPPEILPNGDIIIRRKSPDGDADPKSTDPQGEEIEL